MLTSFTEYIVLGCVRYEDVERKNKGKEICKREERKIRYITRLQNRKLGSVEVTVELGSGRCKGVVWKTV